MSAAPFIRVIVQQCESAELLIDNVDKYTSIGNGIIVMCSFLKRADAVSAEELTQAVQKILAAKIHTVPGTPLKSAFGAPVVTDAPDAPAFIKRDVLVVPQATIAGKLKKNAPQYHDQVDKAVGAQLYQQFCDEFAKQLAALNAAHSDSALHGVLQHGTYGNRQALRMISSGPNTHVFDF
jgi:D-tyrosyl-tRNA(Tyr) deacylase